MTQWVGIGAHWLTLIYRQIHVEVMQDQYVQIDETPVRYLAPGNGKTKTGRLWTYVRDDRPAASRDAPAVWFAYSPDRKSEHPFEHLRSYRGTLQADGFAGFNRLYEKGEIVEAACWAHYLDIRFIWSECRNTLRR